MKIAVDISQINRDRAGVNTYLGKLLKNMVNRSEHEFLLYARQQEELEFELPGNCQWVIIPSVSRLLGGGVTWYWKAGRDMRRRKVDVLIEATMNTSTFFFRRTLMIVHDLSPITMPEHSDLGTRFWYRFNTWLARRYAARIMTVTEQTKQEFKRMYPEYTKEMGVTNEGLNEWVFVATDEEELERVREKLRLPDKFILSHGTIQPRKNHVRMLQAFARLQDSHPDLHYVISGGKGWNYDQVYQEVNQLKLGDKVHFLGFADEQDLPALFDLAQGLMFVSLEEGFGLPVIEARARGLPVLISDIPVFRELNLDEAAVYVDPVGVEDITRGMGKLLDKGKQTPSRDFYELYKWESVADRVLSFVSNLRIS